MSESTNLIIRVMGDAGHAVEALNGLSGSLRSVGAQALGLGASMTAISGPLALVGGVALDTAMDYESAMAIMEATSGATAAQMRAVGMAAVALGADMTLPGASAADAATAMTELSKAGLSVEESMAAARGTLQLAAAAEVSNAEAATIAANALNMFGLEGSEATRVADLLAAGANASSANIQQMAQALQMSGSVAAAAGIPIEDLTTAIGLMANAGIQGSDAGTSLKTMLMHLMSPTDEAAGLMTALGISIYDAQGHMRTIESLINQFSGALSGLTQEQRNTALATIFGTDAVRAANIVLMGGTDAWSAMSGAVNRSGAAASLAGAKMTGLRGALEGMKSTIETVMLGAAEPFLGTLEQLVRGGAALISRVSELTPTLLNAGIAFGAVLAVGGPLLMAFGALAGALGAFATPVGLVIVALGAVAGLMAGLGPTIRAHADEVGDVLGPAWQQAHAVVTRAVEAIRIVALGTLSALGSGVRASMAALRGDWRGAWDEMEGAAITVWTAMLGAAETIWPGMGAMLSNAMETMQARVSVVWGAIEQGWSALVSFFEPTIGRLREAFEQFGMILGTTLGPALENLVAAFGPLGQAVASVMPWLAALGELIGGVIVSAVNVLMEVFAAILPHVAFVVTGIVEAVTGLVEFITGVVNTIVAIIQGDWALAWLGVQQIVQGAVDMIIGLLTAMGAAVVGIVQGLVEGIIAFFQNLYMTLVGGSIVPDLVTGIIGWFTMLSTTLTTIAESIRTMLVASWTAVQTTATTIWTAIQTFLGATWTAVQTTATTIWTAIQDFMSTTWTAVQTLATTIWTAIQTFLGATWTAVQTTATTIWTAIQTFLYSIWSGDQLNVTTIWTAIQAFLGATWAAVQATAMTIWMAIQDFLSTTWTAMQTLATTIWTAIQAFLGATWAAMQTTATTIWTAIQTFLGTTWEEIKSTGINAWSSLRDSINSILDGLVGGVYEKGRALVQRFADGVIGALHAAIDAARRLAQELRDLLPGSDAREGPLSDLGASGRAFGERFAWGVTRGGPEVLDAARAVIGGMSNTISAGGSDLGTAMQAALGPIGAIDVYHIGIDLGMQLVTGMRDAITKGLQDVFGTLPALMPAAAITPALDGGGRGRPAVQDAQQQQQVTINLNGPFYLRDETDMETLARQISAILAGDAATIDRMAVQWARV